MANRSFAAGSQLAAAHISLEAFESSFYQTEDWCKDDEWSSESVTRCKADSASAEIKTAETLAPTCLYDQADLYESAQPWNGLGIYIDEYSHEIINQSSCTVSPPSPSEREFTSVRKSKSKSKRTCSGRRSWTGDNKSSLSRFTLPDKNGKRRIRNDIMSIAESLPTLPGLYFDKKQKGFRVRYQNVYVGWVALSRFASIEEAYCSARDIWENAKAHAEKFQTPQAAVIASLPLQKQAKASGKNRGGRPRTVTQLPAEWNRNSNSNEAGWQEGWSSYEYANIGSNGLPGGHLTPTQTLADYHSIPPSFTHAFENEMFPAILDAAASAGDIVLSNAVVVEEGDDVNSNFLQTFGFPNFPTGAYTGPVGGPSPISFGKPVNDYDQFSANEFECSRPVSSFDSTLWPVKCETADNSPAN